MKMLLYFAIFIILFNIPQLHGLQNKAVVKQSIRSAYGKYLSGHVFKVTSQAAHPQHCLADCWAENDRCQSFNYIVDLDVCELNEASDLTAPQDLIDRSDVVYLTNPVFGREKKPQMPRYTKQMPVSPLDPCASNPCTHAQGCVKDDKLGYRCQDCNSGYHGPRCEEREDPCNSNPCQWGGTCVSTMTSWKCKCPFPFSGSRCTDMQQHQFDLDGTGDHPYLTMKSHTYRMFTANFWFKTAEKNVSYLIYGTATDSSKEERFVVWRVDNIFFVELWKDSVCNFTFPTSYAVNDNNWHLATIVRAENAELSFYLDGVMRDSPKRINNELYRWSQGIIHLGYFKDSNGEEHFFKGSIANFDIDERTSNYLYIRSYMVITCVPRFEGRLVLAKWAGLFNLARPINCPSRIPIMGIAPHEFRTTSTPRWLENEVSPPRSLTAFTIMFQFTFPIYIFPSKPIQIACYGDQGTPCRLSVVIHVNLTLETIIESTRFDLDLLPFFTGKTNLMVLMWTNEGGVFELLINGVLQSRILNIERNGQITGQSRFIVGGSDVENRNFVGWIHNFNVWDKVLSEDMLYLMNLQPGNDMGNVVAWKDFKKPSSISEEQFNIVKMPERTEFRYTALGRNSQFLEFKNAYAYSKRPTPCCTSRTAITIMMWIKLSSFPATLFTIKRKLEETEDMVLRVKENGGIVLSMDNANPQNASLGFIVGTNSWNFLAFTWVSVSGDLHCNINGKHNHISSNFKQSYYFDLSGGGMWTIGGINNSFVGMVSQVNWWFLALPPPALMALSRGINDLDAGWGGFISKNSLVGKVVLKKLVMYYMPDFVCQNKRDKRCDSLNSQEQCNKYYARLGMTSDKGRKFACFCEDQLSKDMNFNYGLGNYENHVNIMKIKPPSYY